jgi:Zn-dependent protease
VHDANDPNRNVPANPYTRRWSAERPPVLEGEYEPKEEHHGNGAKTAGGAAVGLALLLAKFKGLLFLLLNFKWALVLLKLLSFGGSFLLSIWFYALFWGWKFALVFVILIGVHEFGHYFAMKYYGVPSSLPFFIPGMGALVNMKGTPPSAFHESIIALAGPLTGTIGSIACALVGNLTGESFWYAAAYLGFFINLFNLAPVMPLDGGRIVGSISPRLWIGGLVLFVIAMVAFHMFNPLIWILIIVSLPQVWAAWKGRLNPAYYNIAAAQRILIGAAYFICAGIMFAGMLMTRVPVPTHHTYVQ